MDNVKDSVLITINMRIACFGISANPPHLGHLAAARHVLANAPVDEVWIIPCFKHSLGKSLIAFKHRLNMAKFLEGPKIKVCDIERGQGTSYTIKTLKNLRKKYPQHQFSWIAGSGIISKREYKKWWNWNKLKRLIRFYLVPRPGYPFDKNRLPPRFEVLPKILRRNKNISSTLIRDKLKNGSSIKKLVMPKVEKYIIKNKLYLK
jgi:nicotinate-nucleotide adenylyltransferase